MPDDENRVSLLIKWLWAVVTQQRGDLLITGMPSQHVGLEGSGLPFPMGIAGETSISDMDVTMKNAIDNFRGNNA
jgi:NADH dehydrogenase